MGKRFNWLNGSDFMRMIAAGATRLENNVPAVNALNVFPVPDGDTGTNMNLTWRSGLTELQALPSDHLGVAAEVFAKGLLLGARGNSGVILSQLFRGFAESVREYEQIHTRQFAAALEAGVKAAYKAVVKPVEGTVLTVSGEVAGYASSKAAHTDDFAELMFEMIKQGRVALARTPELLPILKQVGVVDAGGEGLLTLYQGFADFFAGVETALPPLVVSHAQAGLTRESIEYGYCTEFFIKIKPGGSISFKETVFRRNMAKLGDSLLVAPDGNLIKVHIHSECPDKVLNHALKYGELLKVHIENMREQHSQLTEQRKDSHKEILAESHGKTLQAAGPMKPYGFVAVCAGAGVEAIFQSFGVDKVVSGGQAMNPSTEEIVQAAQKINAETVYLLPNNANVIPTAEQAVKLINGREVILIPSRTIPQGIAAMLAFRLEENAARNTESMNISLTKVRSGQVTNAVRDAQISGIRIHKGDFLGIDNEVIVAADPDLRMASQKLIGLMLAQGGDMVMIIAGQEAAENQTEEIASFIRETFPTVEIEVHTGGQPLYPYIFSVE